MTELYIFSQYDELLTVITEETGLVSAQFREELNRVAEEPFSFIVEADSESAKHVVEENQVVFRDKEGDLRLFVIKELDDIDNVEGPQTKAICEPAFMELKEHIIVERRPTNVTQQQALNVALEGTRWTGEVEVDLGINSTHFYYISSVDAIWKIIDTWGGDFKDVVEFDEKNNIVARKIKILQRRGADRGKRFEIDHDIEEIQRTVLSYPVTALYGRGASLEILDEEGEHTGGYTRYIDFADVEWKKSKGDPVDKPKGQKWVGDPIALEKYGYLKNDGSKLHRFGIVENHDIEDPKELLEWTWQQLQNLNKPEVNYGLSVHLLEMLAGYEHEHVELGDTAAAIDRQFARPIEVQARVIAIEYDLVDIEGTAFVEMGQFLSAHETDVYRDIEDLKERVNRPIPPITNDSFPDVKPSPPTNVEAIGGFKTIQLYWDYDSDVYISHYEVYGSQVADFVPDTQHLLWRGRVSAFSHEVDTDQKWYYYVRAVNTRGTASEFSQKVSASTVRIISDDILFGSVLAEHLANNLDIADKLAQNTIERINEGPYQALETKIEVDKVINAINISAEDIRINGSKIHLTGQTLIDDGIIGTAAIADAAITRAKLGTAVIGTAQIEDGAITNAKIANAAIDNAKIANVSANKITAGILDTSKISVRGGSATEYVQISGSEFIQRGKYVRTWKGETRTIDSRVQLVNGYLRFSDIERDNHLGFSSNGISTYLSGDGEGLASGTIEFFSQRYGDPGQVGVTITSNFGVVALETGGAWGGNIALNPRDGKLIDLMGPVRVRREITTTSERITMITKDDAYDWFNFGTAYDGSGRLHPTIYPGTDNIGYLGREDKYLRGAYINTVNYGTLSQKSSRSYKENIKEQTIERMNKIIQELKIYSFNYIGDEQLQFGLIAEESPVEVLAIDRKSVVLSNLVGLAIGSIQHLQNQQNNQEDDLEWLRIENQYLKQKMTILENKINKLEEKVA